MSKTGKCYLKIIREWDEGAQQTFLPDSLRVRIISGCCESYGKLHELGYRQLMSTCYQ